MIVSGTFSVKCSNCGDQYNFSEDEADFDNISSEEREMGPEIQYTWEAAFNCDKCNNEIEIEYNVWEHPVGALNTDEVKIEGGTEICRFKYDFHDEQEPDDSE